LPKRLLWTERLFQLIPIGKERGSFASFLAVRLIRSLCVTFIFYLVSVPFYFASGFITQDFNARTLPALAYGYAVFFLVFVVSGWFHNKWDWFFGWSGHILKLSEAEFGKFRDRMERFINSFYPCLAITLIIFSMGGSSFALIMEEFGPTVLRPTVFAVWLASTNFLMMLFMGTLFWIIISMWITFYVTLRQPLNLKLSQQADEEFRPLAIWSLKVLFVSFVLVAIFVVFVGVGVIFVPGYASYVGSLIFFVMLGVLAFLLPFYNVHRVLVKLKKQELLEIEEEHDRIIRDLTGEKSTQVPDTEMHMIYLKGIVSLEALHIRERRAKEADEWPIDTTILSIMVGIVLVPIISQIIINLLSAIFAS
jgi:ABC-type multidrug transport system fused ATPase/permease subunit